MPQLVILLIQIGVILITARIAGLLFRKIHQPQVIGELVAGIMLGPSLLGWFAPHISAALFPQGSLGFLNALSQVGLLVFMFLVGLELNPQVMREKGYIALVTSNVSIIAPFLLGSILALYLYPRVSDHSVPFTHFMLFFATAISMTAFPVLARILAEHDLIRTSVGAVAVASAAIGDLMAWCMLAAVVALVRASSDATPIWITILGSLTYVGIAILGIRPVLGRLGEMYRRRGVVTQDMLAIMLLFVLASAWFTEWLGVHALFGAFLAGAIMPKDEEFVHAVTEKLEDLTVVLLLPLYFAFTGLRTSFGLVTGPEMWFYCTLIIAVAVIGKIGGATITARIMRMPWREAGVVGILMNTRGLVELIVLNLGLDIGVLSPTLFAMMVLMALVTTFMTSPLLEWIYLAPLRKQERVRSEEVQSEMMAQ